MAALVALLVYIIWMGKEDSRIYHTKPERLETLPASWTRDAYPPIAPSRTRPAMGLIIDGYTVVQPAN
jgi:hypothetical protein